MSLLSHSTNKFFKKVLLNKPSKQLIKHKKQLLRYPTKSNKFINFNLPLEINALTTRGFHHGCIKKKRNRNIEYVYGRYSNITNHSLININLTIINLRKSLNFIKLALIQNSKLMILSWSNDLQVKIPTIFRNHFFFKGPWFPGFLSNFRKTRHQGRFWYKQEFFPQRVIRSQSPSTTLMLAEVGLMAFPNLLFAIDTSNLNASAVEEALTIKMPTASIIQPSHFLDFRFSTYPILATSSTYSQGRFIIYLLSLLIIHQAIYFKNKLLHKNVV